MITAQNLSKTFRVHKKEPGLKGSIKSLFKRNWIEKQALNNANIHIEAGEILGLVGANGAGKTTLVKLLAGIIHPTSGTASVLGSVPWERKVEFKKNIALIMGQKAQLWWDLPAADCFLLLKEIYNLSESRFKSNLEELVTRLGVQNQLNIQIRRLSLGERMKMELIAALLHEPKVVFLDEPTIGLDISAQRAIRDFLLDYKRTHKPAMILTSHYMEDIEKLCRRIAIIRQGEIVWDGALAEIQEKFATHKVVTAKLSQQERVSLQPYEFEGDLLEQDDTTIKVSVERNKVAEVASYLMKNFQVSDFTIEEQDVALIIESLMKSASV